MPPPIFFFKKTRNWLGLSVDFSAAYNLLDFLPSTAKQLLITIAIPDINFLDDMKSFTEEFCRIFMIIDLFHFLQVCNVGDVCVGIDFVKG